MEAEQVLAIVEQTLVDLSLSHLQKRVFCYAWQESSYQDVARECGYQLSYVKQAGSQLWQSLSQALGEKVTKSNVQLVLKRKVHELRVSQGSPQPLAEMAVDLKESGEFAPETPDRLGSHPSVSWGEAIDVSQFYGRQHELVTLQQWIMRDRCRLVGVFGMGGIGKTSLSIKIAQQLQAQFEFVVWRSLQNAPPLVDLLVDLLQSLAALPLARAGATPEPERLLTHLLSALMTHLRQHRCLLVLDNLESILQRGDRCGHYQLGYEGYGQLLRMISDTFHASCLLITSREKPCGMDSRVGTALPVKALPLTGLSTGVGQAILSLKGEFFGSADDWQQLVHYYGGNPLALKMAASAIADFFRGQIGEFLTFLGQGNGAFGDLRDLLDQQIDRLSPLEEQVLVWLAILREPATIADLQHYLVPVVSPGELLQALVSLEQRSLLESAAPPLTLQPVVMEYVLDRLIHQISQELLRSHRGSPSALRHFALLQAKAKDYLRESQVRLLLAPLADRLLRQASCGQLAQQVQAWLTDLRHRPATETGYAVGNLLNLCAQLAIDLRHWDLSYLTIWQADLRDVPLHGANLTGAELIDSVLMETCSQILSVALSADGQFLAAGDVSYEIHLWRLADGKRLHTYRSGEGWAWTIAFSPDSRLLAGSANGTVNIWDLATGRLCRALQGYQGRVFCLCFSPDGRTLATGCEDGQIRLWDVVTGQLRQTLIGHEGEVYGLVFLPAIPWLLISGSADHTLRVWQMETGDCLQEILGQQKRVLSLAASPDGSMLASSGSDGTIRLWDIQPLTQHILRGLHRDDLPAIICQWVLNGHQDQIRTLAFSPQGRFLVSGSDDHSVRLWNHHTGECLQILQGHTSWISGVAVSADGQTIVSGSEDQSVRLWDSQQHRCLRVLQGQSRGIWSIAFSPDGQTLFSAGQDRLVHVWQPATSKHLYSLAGHTNWIWSIACSPDGQTIASGSEDCTVRLWSVAQGELQGVLRGHTNAVWSVAFSPDGRWLASGSLDGRLKLWNWLRQECDRTLHRHTSGIWSVVFSSDGQWLASGGQDQSICLWHTHTGDCQQVFLGHHSWIRALAFSPQGQMLVSGASDGVLKLWELATGRCLRTLHAHYGPVLTVCFSPDGQRIASSGGDGVIRLWWLDRFLDSSSMSLALEGHEQWVRCLTYSADGKILASCSQDESIRLWDWQKQRCDRTLRVARPYEGMNISQVKGLTLAQVSMLKRLGAKTCG